MQVEGGSRSYGVELANDTEHVGQPFRNRKLRSPKNTPRARSATTGLEWDSDIPLFLDQNENIF